MLDMPIPVCGPPRAIIEASDKRQPDVTIAGRLSTWVM
jgi:hypothetical protein